MPRLPDSVCPERLSCCSRIVTCSASSPACGLKPSRGEVEFKAAIKALSRRKALVAFQCLGLVFGLATVLLCVNLLVVLHQNPAIPGVHCGSAVKRLVLARTDGDWSQRFTQAQADALAKALPDAVMRYAPMGFD